MKARNDRQSYLTDERGLITLDFIFALTMGIGFGIIFFVLAYSLAAVEVAQYMTFAMARVYNGAHESETLQGDLAKKKFDELTATGAFKMMFGKGRWFQLSNQKVGSFDDEYPESDPDNRIFVGAQVTFQSKILNLKIPVLGPTTSGNGSVGQATLNAYLMREVSSKECRENFNSQRFTHLQKVDPHYAQVNADANKYVLVTDNGC